MLKYRSDDAFVPTSLALIYTFTGFPLALVGLYHAFLWPLATLLLAHVWVIAAYLLHECAHNSVFEKPAHNRALGIVLSWLTGACYTPFDKLREKHLCHHVQREDVLAVNAYVLLDKYGALKFMVTVLTRLGLPAFDMLTHCMVVILTFFRDEMAFQKKRVALVLFIRSLFFVAMASIDLSVLLLYFISWVIFVGVLNFMDAFQHAYEINYSLMGASADSKHDRNYEESHTYSNLLSARFPFLNLLVLNFCYHNVHHTKPNEPWYRLPNLHQQLYPQGCPQYLPFRETWRNFRKYRTERLSSTQSSVNVGVDGVSFLVGL